MWINIVNHVAPFLYKYDQPYGSAAVYKMRNHPLLAKTEVNEKVELHFVWLARLRLQQFL